MRRAPSRTAGWIAVALLAACSSAPEGPVAAKVDVEFRGAGELSFRLRRLIEDSLIDFERDPSREAPLYDAALDLQDHFVAQGYADADVQYELVRGERLRVVFTAKTGPQVTVAAMRFYGNAALRSEQLLELWARTRSGSLGLGDPLYVADDVAAMRLSMLALYDAKGYLDAQVEGPEIARASGASRAEVTWTVVEGPLYHFAAIDVDPALPLDRAALDVDAMPGRVFDRAAVAALAARARRQLTTHGHPEPRIEVEQVVDTNAHTVALRVHGDAGPTARIASLRIAGNEQTADYVISRHFELQEGDSYDGDALERTTSRLYRTGLFRRVEIERSKHADGEDVDLTYRVDEVDALELDLLGGWGSYETARGGVLFTDRNLFGTGQRFTAGARASLKGEALTTSWQEPYLFGSETSLTIGGYARRREEPAFVDSSRGIDLAFQRDLYGPLRGRVGYSLQSRDGSDIDPSIATSADNSYEIGSVFTELLVDRRDSPLYPSRGNRQSLKFEHAGRFAGGSIELDRLTWSSAWFVPFAEPFVLGVAARGGAIWTHGGDVLPVQERFFLGGESTVRSFREAQLGPQSVTGVPTGGSWYQAFNAELRFPIVAAFHGAVFADAGTVGTDVDDLGFRGMRYGLGAGLRLVLPIGPVRVDYARNPDPEPFDEKWVVHFSVGLPF